MDQTLIVLERTSGHSLREQIRGALVNVIVGGNHPADRPLPSCRALSRQLAVAKGTVVQVYQDLIADGLVESRERGGYFIGSQVDLQRVVPLPSAARTQAVRPVSWKSRMRTDAASQGVIERPADWTNHPYPFIYGQVDPAYFPIGQWRECTRLALSQKWMDVWTRDAYRQDAPDFVKQIKTRLLPKRGVNASEDQILVTLGAQNALYLAARLLVGADTVVGFENPGFPDARNAFRLAGGEIKPLRVDRHGLVVDKDLDDCDVVYTTPSHQFPTTVTMPTARRKRLLEKASRQDILIIEDDYECENNYTKNVLPALKAFDRDERVIYIGSLSKTVFPGLRLGFMVGHTDLIKEARALRGCMVRHPPANTQDVAAVFLALGYHEALVSRLHREYHRRWEIMSAALDAYLPGMSRPPSFGGTSFWVRAPQRLDAEELAHEARLRGALIEPATICFFGPEPPRNYFRLGFSSIALNRIRPGVRTLGTIVQRLL